MNLASIRRISEQEVKDSIQDIETWNANLNIQNVKKYFDSDTVDWYAMFVNKREMVALAAVAKPEHSVVAHEIFVNQICAKSGAGYGRILMKSLYNFFNKRHPDGFKYFGFTSNPEAGPELLNYYLKWFNKDTGWDCWKTRMGWDHFQKKFD